MKPFIIALIALVSVLPLAAEDKPAVIRIGYAGVGSGNRPIGGGSTSSIQADWKSVDNEVAADGIRVTHTYFSGAGPAVNEALANGQLDFAFQGDLPALVAKAGGLRTRLILANSRFDAIYIVVPSSSTAQKLEDLKGKRVAVFKGTNLQLAFYNVLAAKGWKDTEFKTINLSTADGNAAILSGDIDAQVTGPDAFALVDRGVARIVYDTKGKPIEGRLSHLLVTEDFAARYPALVQRVVIARDTIRRIGYTHADIGFDHRTAQVVSKLHRQSPDIAQGVDVGGAGDQGLMFGFATRETPSLLPLPIHLAHRLVERLHAVREDRSLPWLRPDGKSQVTVEYEGDRPVRVHTVVISTQHDASVVDPASGRIGDAARRQLIEQVIRPVIPPGLWNDRIIFHLNPTGLFLVGGPHGDSGLTGRKIIVDSYGGRGRHGGGAFSGKDPSKVDRSAAYLARYVAKNLVASGLADTVEVQLAYAIGVAEPVSVHVSSEGTGRLPDERLARLVREHFPLTPRGIIEHLGLRRPIYQATSAYGHFGREPDGDRFAWERTDQAEALARHLPPAAQRVA